MDRDARDGGDIRGALGQTLPQAGEGFGAQVTGQTAQAPFSTEKILLAFLLASGFSTPAVLFLISLCYAILGMTPLAPCSTRIACDGLALERPWVGVARLPLKPVYLTLC